MRRLPKYLLVWVLTLGTCSSSFVLATAGGQAGPISPDGFGAFIAAERARWHDMAKETQLANVR